MRRFKIKFELNEIEYTAQGTIEQWAENYATEADIVIMLITDPDGKEVEETREMTGLIEHEVMQLPKEDNSGFDDRGDR